MNLSRRAFLGNSAALAAGIGFSDMSHAATQIVATTYPGSFDEAFKGVVGPAFAKSSGGSVSFTPLLGVDQIGKIQASRNAPPFDVVLFDEGPLVPAIESGVLEKFPAEKSKGFADIPQAFRHPDGYAPVITVQLIGIAYNPKKVKTPPTSWEDLWKPEYKGRVGITGLGSSLGTAFMVEIAKMNGGSETNIEPAFEAMKKLLPNVGAIAASPGALAALFQQGEIDIAFNYWNNVALLAAKGVDIAFASPKTGAVAVRSSAQIVKNNQAPKLVLDYLDAVMSFEVQKALEASPWVMMPTNKNVPLTGANLTVAKSVDDLVAKSVLLDWTKFQPLRGEWITRFTKEVRI
ncbi:ABC transporter substrate-binding protein [Bradyrhizobium sp. LHD-71]|uniref:ABC transporter substrate-binding protein n=1 Tax=Bradyrhizobium sp. LHD-71 TaxID=3072141 RepID=UPI00280E7C7D|nr:ABC transporter substrate-binding protein [Bradyrhizobium sp. LHD-71]MDQ8728249.1 ABC transporter substrate-binding protein [Bradyrhizobium sp. LHD-71]